MKLITLQFQTSEVFEDNLEKLINLIQKCEKDSLILAPEVSLTSFSYDRFDSASEFSLKALDRIKKATKDKTFAFTIVEKIGNEFFNVLKVIRDEKIIYQQRKFKLFPLGDEPKHFSAGKEEDIKIFEIDGLKIASLICFELRFVSLWERVKGADIILVPAMWGKPRKEHFETLCKALAISNQAFVVASDSANFDMAKSSAIISPFGNLTLDDKKELIELEMDKKEITKMRKYIDIGLLK